MGCKTFTNYPFYNANPLSNLHLLLQPSFDYVFPSSHYSASALIPSPQIVTHLLVMISNEYPTFLSQVTHFLFKVKYLHVKQLLFESQVAQISLQTSQVLDFKK